MTTTTTTETRMAAGMTVRVERPGVVREGRVVEVNGSMARIEWTRNPAEKWVPCSIASAPGWTVAP
jgi:hypothetical protein